VVTDLATTNGTFVNDERVVGPATIGLGDVIRVGRVTCTVVPPVHP
jgi:pSer/pThr/pTyr-binding forkhead associated (FHA) protein